MKSITLTLLSFIFLTSLNAQNWSTKNGKIYTLSETIIGASTEEEQAALTLISNRDTDRGGGYGLLSRHSTDHLYMKFNSKSIVGYTSLWSSQSQCGAFASTLTLNRDNASQYNSHSAAGLFTTNLDNYKAFDNGSNIHYLGGVYGLLMGTINTQPKNSIIAGIIGEDKIRNDKTFGGYFVGRGYFSDNVGFGTKTPNAKVEVANGDIFISDINKGIIMKAPDGACWRGTLDNDGNLTFKATTCPIASFSTTAIKQVESSVPKNTIEFNVFPNPSQDYVVLKIRNEPTKDLKYIITDLNGKAVKKGEILTKKQTINITDLSDGAFLLSLIDETNNELGSTKIVKK